jgi:hypothetical protein
MSEASPAEIESYVASVIETLAGDVSQVAPVAAQAAVEMSGLTIPIVDDGAGFIEKLSDYCVRLRTVHWSEFLVRLRDQYADSDLTPAEMLDEVIASLNQE